MRWLPVLACSIAAATAQPPWGKLEPSPEAQAKLEANGFVVIDKPLKQGFSAYIEPQHPAFITSDSILMAYHRVFEEYCARQDIAKLAELRRCLPELWQRLPTKPLSEKGEDVEGLRRARLLLATAWKLLSGEFPEGTTEAEKAKVKAEEELVLSGAGTHVPAWLGPGDPKNPYVNYHAFDPGSFGGGSALMGRYHRCRKWLQEMRVDTHDNPTRAMAEHLLFAMAGIDERTLNVFTETSRYGDEESGIFQIFQDRTGGVPIPLEQVEEWRKEIGERLRHEGFVRLLPAFIPYGSNTARELLKEKCPEKTSEFLAAGLGNSLAASRLPDPLRKRAARPELRDWTPYLMGALMALNDADPRSPAVFRSEAWSRKQLNTTLGSWTEYRYAVQLGSRDDSSYLGMEQERPAGFVEPVPQFFLKLGEAAEELAGDFSSNAGLKATTADAIAIRLDLWAEGLREAAKLTREELERKSSSLGVDRGQVDRLFKKEGETAILGWSLYMKGDCLELAEAIGSFLKDYWKGEPAAVSKLLMECPNDGQDPGPKLWKLATTCYRLQTLAEKQLSGQAWNKNDEFFLTEYGHRLADLMFYGGNSYLDPHDDAPRIVRYATLASPGKTQAYHAATARPRLLLIRYPGADGKEVLCQGSVYAYRDVQRPETPALKEWQAESEKAPWPEWMKPIVGAYEPPPVKEREK